MVDAQGNYVEGGRRRAKKRRRPFGCLAALLVMALLVGGLWIAADRGIDWVSAQFGEPEDYPGPGTGSVLFEVREGDSATAIGRNLKDAGVVASVDAFIAVADAEPRASGIQVGHYPLRKEMSARGALDVLIEPDNIVQARVTIPEGLRVVDIVDRLAEETDFGKAQWRKALGQDIGLPDWAEGNPEGYLFPATYEIRPDERPVDVLRKMVDRWRKAADDANLEERAAELGRSPAELMTIASLVQAEGRGDDMPKVSRVIWNRLDGEGSRGGTYGLLQIDAAVNYALDRTGVIRLTQDEIASVADSPYNTYEQAGLPPTPINSPGDAAIDAAANPADGPWYYYVTVDLSTGETKFAETHDEFLTYKAEYQAYCETSDAC
jgi:UPF0755 protein